MLRKSEMSGGNKSQNPKPRKRGESYRVLSVTRASPNSNLGNAAAYRFHAVRRVPSYRAVSAAVGCGTDTVL